MVPRAVPIKRPCRRNCPEANTYDLCATIDALGAAVLEPVRNKVKRQVGKMKPATLVLNCCEAERRQTEVGLAPVLGRNVP